MRNARFFSIPAFGGVVYGLSQLGRGASGSGVALGFIALGLVCMLIFGWRQLRLTRGGRSPLLDLRAFRFPMYSLSLALLCLAMLSLFGIDCGGRRTCAAAQCAAALVALHIGGALA